MHTVRKKLPILLLVAVLAASCAGQPPAPTQDVNAMMTESVGTFMAQFFLTQTAMVTPATPTPLDTPTFIPSSTPLALPSAVAPTATYVIYATSIVYPTATPTGTYYTATPNPSTLAYGCNNLGLINDIALSFDTVKPGDTFTKTWQVANTGTCEWKFNYRLVFVSGENMDGVGEKVGNDIPVNKWTQIRATMTAPKNAGTYTAYWQLSDTSGHTFGASLKVTIKVKTSYP